MVSKLFLGGFGFGAVHYFSLQCYFFEYFKFFSFFGIIFYLEKIEKNRKNSTAVHCPGKNSTAPKPKPPKNNLETIFRHF